MDTALKTKILEVLQSHHAMALATMVRGVEAAIAAALATAEDVKMAAGQLD